MKIVRHISKKRHRLRHYKHNLSHAHSKDMQRIFRINKSKHLAERPYLGGCERLFGKKDKHFKLIQAT